MPLLSAGGGAITLVTVTETTAEVARFPAASRATANRLCGPRGAAVLFQARTNGAAAMSGPRFVPSSLNCTPATPVLSEAVAETNTFEPDTVALLAGVTSHTVGGMMSGGGVAPLVAVRLLSWLKPWFPARSEPWTCQV